VSVTQVTDQFLAYVEALDSVGADILADFLVMASRLVYIKSRALLPRPQPLRNDDEEEDPAEALARQLREYKRFRNVAADLRGLEEVKHHSFVRVPGKPELERHLDTGGMNVSELLKAARAAFMALPAQPSVGTVLAPFRVTIREQIELIAQATAGRRTASFQALLRHARHRVEVVVTLLALLELLKRRQIVVEQSTLFGDILIHPVEGAEIIVPAAAGAGERDEAGELGM
jgi:segregation and condensation protein A